MLDKTQLKESIKTTMLANISSPTQGQQDEVEAFALGLSNAIDTYVRGLTITYTSGLIAPSGGGPVTGTFGFSLN